VTATGRARKERYRDADVAADGARDGSGRHLSVAADPRVERVAAARAQWKARLVDLGGPNTLLRFRDTPDLTLDLGRAHLGSRAQLLGGEPTLLSHLVREPSALADARSRAAAIARVSDTLVEEHGVRTCFLAIGTVSWTIRPAGETDAGRQTTAPLLLRACTVRPVDAGHREWIVEPGPELEVNPVLVHYMSSAHGIDLDTEHLEELALTGSTVDAYPTYAALAESCLDVPGLSVSPRVVIGTFPYFKAALVADFDAVTPEHWSGDLVAALAGEGLSPPAGGAMAPGGSPERFVLPSDSVQRAAVEDARAGAPLVVEGPVGTGKTQTVANLVATLAADGHRTLLVSAHRAGLDDVLGRLARVGLADLVLDVRGGGHERRRVVRELVQGLDGLSSESHEDPGGAGRAVMRRGQAAAALDEHVGALHEVREPWGVSLHQVQEAVCAFSTLPAPPRSRVRLGDEVLARLDPTSLATAVRTLTRVAELSRWDGDGAGDPWFGARLEDEDEVDEARRRVDRLADGGVEEVARTLADVFRGVQIPRQSTVLDWGRVLRTTGDVRDTLEVFRPEVFDIPLGDLVTATASARERRTAGSGLGAVDRWRLRRQARGLLRPGVPPEDLHGALAAAHEQRDAWRELAGSGGRPEIPVELDRGREAHARMADDLRWLDQRLPGPDEGGADLRLVELDLPALQTRVDELAASSSRLDVGPEVRAALDSLDGIGLRPLTDDLRGRAVAADDIHPETEWVWWCSIAEQVGRDDVRVATHDGRVLTGLLDDLAEAERTALAVGPARVRAAVAGRVREVRRRHPTQETRLRAEAVRVRPAPLPELVGAAPALVTAVRPCWAMSALDVPSVLPPGENFDVVVLDDASALAAAESLPALLRAGRVVVVGDGALPPPSTFTTGAPTAGGRENAEPPSVLELLGPVLPTRHLRWHYRSRDGRLVDFVRDHVYDSEMVTFPDTDQSPVTRLEYVEGYGVVAEGDGAVETTRAEVDRVVTLVLEHARTRSQRTLAVVALSPTHAERVEQSVRRAAATTDERTRRFFDPDRTEPFVVRALDRAQGLERDDIIVTVGFGKTPHGRVLHRFDVLGSDAGHRYLTVALTRARRTTTVVSTIRSDELDPARLRRRGPLLLRTLLHDLEGRAPEGSAASSQEVRGQTPTPAPGVEPARNAPAEAAGSVLMADLARRLRDHGLTVHERVGTGPDPVDLAVEDPTRPGSLLLAVESDGPRYAAGGDARDRDLLHASALSERGWRHLRVWSTDLFRDPARDVARILEALGCREAPGD
jgi:very-short-patch-repair endonuclease